MKYRPDVDGLRAIAVLAVVFFHAGLGCTGGYVGVDVFFVISGYLITSLILRDLDRGSFSLGMFWERRIRRIFPALAVMVLFTAVAGWFLLLPDDLAKLGSSIVAQALGVSNFYFWRTTNYFGGQNLEKPLLHTWSLAVEEQFYLLFPLLLIFLFRHAVLRRRVSLLGVFLLMAVVSLALSVWGVIHQPYATFFLLPTRAWELLSGSMIAVLPAAWHLRRGIWRELACFLGLGGILIPIFTYTEETPFPGLTALAPCLGASLVIWGCVRRDGDRGTWCAHILAWRPVVFIGLISYSLYLWHWPVLVFANYWKTEPYSAMIKASLCLALLLLAILSWRFVEKPFRKSRGSMNSLRGIMYGAFASSLLVTSLGITYAIGKGFGGRLSPEANNLLREVSKSNQQDPKRKNVSWVNTQDVLRGDIPRIGSDTSQRKILLWGDSHAEQLAPLVDKVCKRLDISGEVVAAYSTPPLLDPGFKLKNSLKGSDGLGAAVVDYVAKIKFSDVLIAAYWSNYQSIAGKKKFEELMNHTIKALNDNGAHVWIILDPPTYHQNITLMLLRNLIYYPTSGDNWKVTKEQHYDMNEVLFRMKERNTNSNLKFIDPSPQLLSEDKNIYRLYSGGFLIYSDGNHLLPKGVDMLFQPMLMKALLEGKETTPR